jgi:hypothetical protein
LRRWIGTEPKATRRWPLGALFIGFFAWFVCHILFGLWP